nr:DUF932 domain-containing protein [Verrucomicrobium spinosum]
MTLGQIQAAAPSIFADSAHESRSNRYTHIPTSEVLTRLMAEDFQVHAVMQGGSRDEQKRGFTKHLLRLRHASQALTVGGTHNEIVLLNSHDGTSSYRLMAGVFRLVCGNGMVVAENSVADVRISHKGNVSDLVLDGCVEVLNRLPEVSESVRQMSDLRLTSEEQALFASSALIAKYGDEPAPVTATQLLNVRRRDDAPSNLWNTLNTVQENVIRGGISYIQRDDQGRRVARRQTREVRGIDQNTNLNRALWALAEGMKQLKA